MVVQSRRISLAEFMALPTAHIHDADAPTRVVRWDSTLTDEELLPGLELPLRVIFPAPPKR